MRVQILLQLRLRISAIISASNVDRHSNNYGFNASRWQLTLNFLSVLGYIVVLSPDKRLDGDFFKKLLKSNQVTPRSSLGSWRSAAYFRINGSVFTRKLFTVNTLSKLKINRALIYKTYTRLTTMIYYDHDVSYICYKILWYSQSYYQWEA